MRKSTLRGHSLYSGCSLIGTCLNYELERYHRLVQELRYADVFYGAACAQARQRHLYMGHGREEVFGLFHRVGGLWDRALPSTRGPRDKKAGGTLDSRFQ